MQFAGGIRSAGVLLARLPEWNEGADEWSGRIKSRIASGFYESSGPTLSENYQNWITGKRIANYYDKVK